MLNISSGGAALQTTKYLRVGNRCPLVFRGSVGELALQATVAWSRLVGTVAVAEKEVESVYVAGLSFADVPKVKRRLLERLIAAEAGSKTGKAAAGSESGDPQESARSAGPPGQGSASSSVLPFLDERDRQTRDATSRCGFVRETRNTFDRLFENGDSRFVGTADDQNEDA